MKKTFVFVITLCLVFFVSGLSVTTLATNVSTRGEDGSYVGRNFDEDFDVVYDDCDTTEGYLLANYSSTNGISADDAIFKSCSPTNEFGTYDYLVFRMKGYNEAELADLNLAFRKLDSLPLLVVNFSDLLDPDLDAFKDMPEKALSNEYQTYVINLNDSLDGMYYDAAKTVAADNKFLGFHLMAKTDTGVSGTLEISEIYFSKLATTESYVESGDNFLIDNFKRSDVNKVPAESTIWWCGSACGFTVYGNSIISENSSYQKELLENNSMSHVALVLKGTTGLENVKVTFGDKTVSWNELKDSATTNLPTITSSFATYVIDLASNSFDANFKTIKVESDGIVYLDKVFGTNLEVNSEKPEYPTLDSDTLIYDDFDREELGAFDQYQAENEVAQANGFDYLICYAGLNDTSIQNGALVFDNTSAANGYFQYKSHSQTKANNGSYPYVVFKVKVSDGGLLSNLRFQTLQDDTPKGDVMWANGGLLSAKGLPVATINQENYEYVTVDGWTYIIVDLACSNMSLKPSGFDIYWSGDGKLYIGSIFFAKNRQIKLNEETKVTYDDFGHENFPSENHWWNDTNGTLEEGALKLTATGGYTYFRGAGKQGFQNADTEYPYLVLTMKGVDGATLKTLRIEGISIDTPHIWVKDGGIYLADGSVLSVDALTSEYQTFVIDLEKSGFNKHMEGIGFGYDGEGETGSLYIDYVGFADMNTSLMDVEKSVLELEPVTITAPVITISDKTVSISGTPNALSYDVYFNGELVKNIKATDELTYQITNPLKGENKVVVVALGNGVTTLNSENSNEAIYNVTLKEIVIKEHAKETFANNEEFNADGIVIEKIYSDGSKVEATSSEITVTCPEYDKAKGGVFEANVALKDSTLTLTYKVVVKAASSGCGSAAVSIIISTLASLAMVLVFAFKKRS